MAARRNFRLALLFLLLSGAVGDSTGNASTVSDTPSTNARITNNLDNKLTSLVTSTRHTIESFTSKLVLPSPTMYPSDQLKTSGVMYVITTDVLPAMSSLMTTIVPSGSQVLVSSSFTAMTILSSLIQPTTTTNGHLSPSFTISPSGSQVMVSSPSAAMTMLSTLIQPTTTGHPSSSLVVTTPVLSTSPSLPGASSMLPMSSSSEVVFKPTAASVTASVSLNVTPSVSLNVTPSVSLNVTLSVSLTVTPSVSLNVTPSVSLNVTPSVSSTVTKSKAEENRKLLLYIAPPAGLVVLICILIGTILCIRRYRRMRKWRLQLMPLHNLDNADSDEEELLNDDEAPTFQVSTDEARQPILSFD